MIEFDAVDTTYRSQVLNDLRQRFDYEWVESFAQSHGSPVLIFDKTQVDTRYEELQNAFPRIKHHFAIKPLPLQPIVASVVDHDGYLDVASVGEIEMALKQGISTPRMIHTNPHRKLGDIKHAIDSGVERFVIDNVGELEKFKPYRHRVKVLLRLSYPNDLSQVNLSYKFGVSPADGLVLLGKMLEAGMDVIGVSMHVGSQSDHTGLFVQALEKTAAYFVDAKEQYGHTFQVLDIGGGFPAPSHKPVQGIQAFADEINPLLEKHFADMEVISEPGRYIVNSSLTLVSSVVGKSMRGDDAWYFVDDGLYGAYSGILFDFSGYIMYGAKELDGEQELKPYIIGGPTCDSHDIIHDKMLLPELGYGDLILTPNIGAYSWTHSTNFNLIPRPKVIDLDGTILG